MGAHACLYSMFIRVYPTILVHSMHYKQVMLDYTVWTVVHCRDSRLLVLMVCHERKIDAAMPRKVIIHADSWQLCEWYSTPRWNFIVPVDTTRGNTVCLVVVIQCMLFWRVNKFYTYTVMVFIYFSVTLISSQSIANCHWHRMACVPSTALSALVHNSSRGSNASERSLTLAKSCVA